MNDFNLYAEIIDLNRTMKMDVAEIINVKKRIFLDKNVGKMSEIE